MTHIDSITEYVHTCGKHARRISRVLSCAKTAQKNQALENIASHLESQIQKIIHANGQDLQSGKQKGLSEALLDRLELDSDRIMSMASGLRDIAALPDPVGQISGLQQRPSGIRVGKMRVPIGVIFIIYESRPNVTADAAALCLKSGNAVILRGGSEAINSNLAIAESIQYGLKQAGLSEHVIQILNTTDRDAVGQLVKLPEYIDVVIPRGGRSLIERISADSDVPVIKHLDGICHVYIDDDADIDKAIAVAYNAKTRRYGICGAMETLLVAASVVEQVLPELCRQYQQKGVELRGCEKTRKHIDNVVLATDSDWASEYLAPILSIKVVAGLDEAIEHISKWGSAHTDSIITENISNADKFVSQVDSSSVMVNASTQFADGFEYGLGAEIGISTNKLHVRGPVGLEGLTTEKFVVYGDGSVRD